MFFLYSYMLDLKEVIFTPQFYYMKVLKARTLNYARSAFC